MLLNKLFPKNVDFFDILDVEIETVVQAVSIFKSLIVKGEIDDAGREQMRDIEHEGDKLAYSIIDRLNKTFVTPFDREDIHTLAKKIDDINDILNGIIRRMKVYRVKKISPVMVEFAGLIQEAVNGLSCAIHGLRDRKESNNVLKACMDVARLESHGDKLRNTALTELFDKEKDPIEIIKWKDIYQDAEAVLDVCKEVAHTLTAIMVKQA
jgi:uncharacterized protein Yka (UPF0111/DUF47 family)